MPTTHHKKYSYRSLQITPDNLAAREIILKFGLNAASYQIVNSQITKFFPKNGVSVIGYVKYYGVQIVATEPVAPPPFLKEVTAQFLKSHPDSCFFGATKQFTETLSQLTNPTAVCIGSQPCWDLQKWDETVLAVPSNREQFRRARAKGVTIRELTKEEIKTNSQLKDVLKIWLAHRRFSPLHFLVESNTLDFVFDRRIFVAEYQGKILAWLNLCPIPQRKGWLTEQFPRLPDAPNGTVDFLLHTAAQQLAREGHQFLTMGLVPISKAALLHPKPIWLQWVFRWVKAHGNRFYNFDGLENYKSKFRPHSWELLYAVAPQPKFRFKHLLAIARAFTQDPLIPTLLKGAIRSLKQEANWLKKNR